MRRNWVSKRSTQRSSAGSMLSDIPRGNSLGALLSDSKATRQQVSSAGRAQSRPASAPESRAQRHRREVRDSLKSRMSPGSHRILQSNPQIRQRKQNTKQQLFSGATNASTRAFLRARMGRLSSSSLSMVILSFKLPVMPYLEKPSQPRSQQ